MIETRQPAVADPKDASFSVRVGRVDSPGLHGSPAKNHVDRSSKQVDGSSNVEDGLPFFYGVLRKARGRGMTVYFGT